MKTLRLKNKLIKKECHAELVSASYKQQMLDSSRNKFGMTIQFLTLLIICVFYLYSSSAQCATASATTAVQSQKQTSTISTKTKTATAARPQTTVQPTVQPQSIDYASCNKVFNIDSQKLLYLTLSSINANRFTIDEIQSTSGYATFYVGQLEFLASVITINSQNSMLKITPCNNNYFFPIGIVQNIFKYIELNINTPVEKLQVS